MSARLSDADHVIVTGYVYMNSLRPKRTSGARVEAS